MLRIFIKWAFDVSYVTFLERVSYNIYFKMTSSLNFFLSLHVFKDIPYGYTHWH